MKFAKVMFLQVSVCPEGRGSALLHAGMHPTRSRHPQGADPLGADTPQEQTLPGADTPPPRADTPGSRHPPATVHAGRYGQQAGGTHPTGMQSCLFWQQEVFFFLSVEFIPSNWFCLMQPNRTKETTENSYQYINAR